jgi:hypothetical protein
MTDKEIKQRLIIIEGKLYAIMQQVALVTAKLVVETPDEALISRYEAAVKRMNDDAETRSRMLLNELEAQDLADGDQDN